MDFNNYPDYAVIERHIRAARIERAPVIAEAIAGFVMKIWNAIQEPPAAPAILPIDRRRESRTGVPRFTSRLAVR